MNIEEESQELYIQLRTAQQALDEAKKQGVEAELLVFALEAMKKNPAVSIQKAIINGFLVSKECIQ
jgi:hypothetical protein